MKVKNLISAIAFITFANCAKSQDSTALVSAFFGLDNKKEASLQSEASFA
jgi:hypothetical protein